MKTLIKSSKTARGFSLIEIMIVMALIGGIIVGIVLYVGGQSDTIREDQARTKIQTLKQNIERFQMVNGRYPTTAEGLDATIAKSTKQADREALVRDPWGTPLNYISPGIKNPEGFDLFSSGKDKTPNTPDDIWAD